MSETLLDYAINSTPYPIQASPSTGNPNLASLTLVVSNSKGHIITCSGIALSFRIGTHAPFRWRRTVAREVSPRKSL